MGRQSERQASFLNAKGFGFDNSIFDCQVVDVSESGARLYVSDRDVPNEFVLSIPVRGVSYFCECIRKDGDFVGVRFVMKGDAL